MSLHLDVLSSDRRLLAELHDSERRYRTMIDNITDIIVDSDAEGRVVYINKAWTEVTGISLEETLSRGALAGIHPDDHALAAEHMAAAASGEDDGSAREVRIVAHDGSIRWMELRGRALFDEDGTLTGFTGIAHDVTDRREAEARVRQARDEAEAARDEAQRSLVEAERARDEAEAASRAKSEFLSRMSHELRTPLNAILGFGQLLELARLPGEDAENVQQILRAGSHLLDLINEVLDVVRIEAGAVALSLEPVDVGEAVTESLALVSGAAAARGIAVEAPDRHSGLTAHADRRRLKQVLINLLSNAVKYNRDAGRVVVRCAALAPQAAPAGLPDAGHGWLRVSVADTGRGIREDQLDAAFTPFERLGAEHSGIEGSGVGLAVAKALVEALGGRVGVSSEPGRGSTFWLDLPAAAPAAPGQPEVAAPPLGQTRTVLYVEDDPANVTLVRRILGHRPHVRVTVAHDGADGLEQARRTPPALVLLDLHLPGLHGADVLRALRSDPHPALRAVPVVVVTADVTDGTDAQLMDAGATAVVTKPFNVRQMLAILDAEVPVR